MQRKTGRGLEKNGDIFRDLAKYRVRFRRDFASGDWVGESV